MTDVRTWLASVLFLDIVGYTKVPVDQQMAIKLHFTSIVSSQIAHLVADECLQLDTGDGCAICYLGDPEKLYPVAISLLQNFKQLESDDEPVTYQVRLGLNLGPIKLVSGIGENRNCVGAGINDAQRVMDFAEPNQLFVAKSYVEMVSNMSAKYADELVSAGSRTDKHNKVHDIFELASLQSPAQQPSVAKSNFCVDPEVSQQILREYAKFVGTDQAQTQMDAGLKAASSTQELCELLANNLNEDDRYHFAEFTRYYGYSSS